MLRKLNAILLLFVITITVVPFNALHHHEEDSHYHALIFKEVSHHCELDHQWCNTNELKNCNHNSHLSKPITKCFSCNFHFSISLLFANSIDINKEELECFLLSPFCKSLFSIPAAAPGNKGPPMIS